MKTITVKVPVELAEEIEQLLEEYGARLQARLEIVKAARERIKKPASPPPVVLNPETGFSSLAQLSESSTLLSASHKHQDKLRSAQGYGKARDAVIDFLKSRNGAGVTIKEIQAQARVSYGSAYRYLKLLGSEKLVKKGEDGRVWIYCGSSD